METKRNIAAEPLEYLPGPKTPIFVLFFPLFVYAVAIAMYEYCVKRVNSKGDDNNNMTQLYAALVTPSFTIIIHKHRFHHRILNK